VVISFDLLSNAILSGLLVGGFYAALASGATISFGLLDVANIAHPAFAVIGAYCAFIVNSWLGADPIVTGVVLSPLFFVFGLVLYQVYHVSFERRGTDTMRGLAFFFGLMFIAEVVLIIVFGVDYRYASIAYATKSFDVGPLGFPLRLVVPFVCSLALLAGAHLYLARTFTGRAVLGVSQDPMAIRLMGGDPVRLKRIAFGLSIALAGMAGSLLIVIEPVEPSIGRDFIGRVFAICVLGGMGSLPGTLIAAVALGIIENLTSVFIGASWSPAVAFGLLLLTLAVRPSGLLGRSQMQVWRFPVAALLVSAVLFAAAHVLGSDYVFYAGYTVLQFVVLASAWNILGGYVGYVNFGAAAFLSLGAYSAVAINKLVPLPLPILMLVGGVVSGLVGLGTGYLTLRLRGIFFAIATFALAMVAQTLITNWDFVGGSAGVYVIRPRHVAILGSYIEYMFLLMLLLVVVVISTNRAIERSRIGLAFTAVRDDEMAAEAAGVPTLRLKLLAATLSGAFMGMAGAPLPYYVTFLEPSSAFSLSYAVNTIAMPLVGGTTVWWGPVIGAVLLGTAQQVATVTISSEVNLLIVGILLVGFVILAPNGLAGLFRGARGRPGR